jgi:DNA-binding ferritin-like protein
MHALNKLLKQYSSYDNSKEVEKMIKLFNKLDYKKLAKKTHTKLESFKDDIENKNESMFSSELELLPGVKLSNIWSTLTSDVKNKFWLSLKIIFISGEMIVSLDNVKTDGVNVFEGLKGGDFDVDGMKEAYGDLDVASGGMEAFMKVMGGDKMKQLSQLTDQLKNLTDDDIDEATQTIQGLLGNSATGMDEMLKVISSELKSGKSLTNSSDLMGTLNSVAEAVANKMRPKIESGQIDGEKLFSSTQDLMKNMIPKEQADALMGQLNNFDLSKMDLSNMGNLAANLPGNLNMDDLQKQLSEMNKTNEQ